MAKVACFAHPEAASHSACVCDGADQSQDNLLPGAESGKKMRVPRLSVDRLLKICTLNQHKQRPTWHRVSVPSVPGRRTCRRVSQGMCVAGTLAQTNSARIITSSISGETRLAVTGRVHPIGSAMSRSVIMALLSRMFYPRVLSCPFSGHCAYLLVAIHSWIIRVIAIGFPAECRDWRADVAIAFGKH